MNGLNEDVKSKKKRKLQTIIFIIFGDFLMFYQILLSPQVKRYRVICNKYDINKLLHELINDFSLGS